MREERKKSKAKEGEELTCELSGAGPSTTKQSRSMVAGAKRRAGEREEHKRKRGGVPSRKLASAKP